MHWHTYVNMNVHVCMHVKVCVFVVCVWGGICVCVSVVFWERERGMTDICYPDMYRTSIILIVSPLLSNATECLREISPFHIDNRI